MKPLRGVLTVVTEVPPVMRGSQESGSTIDATLPSWLDHNVPVLFSFMENEIRF